MLSNNFTNLFNLRLTVTSPYLIPAGISYPLFHLYYQTHEMSNTARNKSSLVAALSWPITLPYMGVSALFETVTGQMYKRIKLKISRNIRIRRGS